MKIVTLTGPSCAGKTTLCRELLKTGHFTEIVSFTTRNIRPDEVEGVDYYFYSKEQVKELIGKNMTAEFTEFKGNTYGVEIKEIKSKLLLNKIPLLIVEPNGLAQIEQAYRNDVYSVYVDAPIELLHERFLERFKDSCIKDANTDTRYNALRLKGIQEEWRYWGHRGRYNFFIDRFTSDNKESIISSLVDVLLKEKEKSD